MTTSAPPPGESSSPTEETSPPESPPRGWTDVRFRWINLLLLVPLVSILPFLFNSEEPTLAGLPFFYWFQLLVIPVGILCTVAVHRLTRHVDEEGEQ
ncbi:hypothetical protein GCM10023200_17550 [Actinomycetospora chlora]|uniref:DUF3311 domain-containing protein n=1 Tax=Actinomycetospora chlora TaxID=663608 RepID=A0ABP9AQ59_9PSEU